MRWIDVDSLAAPCTGCGATTPLDHTEVEALLRALRSAARETIAEVAESLDALEKALRPRDAD
jgi:hypothetical protein